MSEIIKKELPATTIYKQQQEIERLNKLLSIEKKYREKFDKDNQRLYKENKQLRTELNRSNNIIKELEKDLENRYYGRGKYHMDSNVVGIEEVWNKIQELKVSDEE